MFLLARLRALFHSIFPSGPPRPAPRIVERVESRRPLTRRLPFHLNYDPDDITPIEDVEHTGQVIRDPLWNRETPVVGGWTHLLAHGDLDQHSPALRDLVRKLAEREQQTA